MKVKQGAPVLELKALDEAGMISGYGSVFGNKDSYGDIVVKGAFGRSLTAHRKAGTRPRMFFGHDSQMPIGSWTELAEDDTGLMVTGRLNMDVQKAREAYALLRDGDIDGLSIGYRVVREQRDEAQDANLLKEVSLVEVSVVSLPANPLATVGAVKMAELADLRARLAAGPRRQAARDGRAVQGCVRLFKQRGGACGAFVPD